MATCSSDQQQCDVYDLVNFAVPGKLVIFSQFEFDHDPRMMRMGTNTDANRLDETFSALGIQVDCCKDFSCDAIQSKIKHYATRENYDECGCLIVAVLTHGGENGLLWAKDKPFHISDIWQPFVQCEPLRDKPKIFLFQACRGENEQSTEARFEVEQDAGNSRQKPVLPHANNFLLAYSTTEGLTSYRSKEQGSWYIQTLCDSMSHADIDLLTVLTKVNYNVTQNFSPNLGQTPEFTSYLQYKVVLSSAAIGPFKPSTLIFNDNASTSEDSGAHQQFLFLDRPAIQADNTGQISKDYRLPCNSPGATIIFHSEEYEIQADQFLSVFQDLNFCVSKQLLSVCQNNQIVTELQEYTASVRDAASILVVILATIGEDRVIDTNTTFKQLTRVVCGKYCKPFRTKPKIFLYLDPQKARGDLETDATSKTIDMRKFAFCNNHSDFLRYFGYGQGSVQRVLLEISALQYIRDDLMHALTRSLVCARRDHRDYMSYVQSSLTKRVVLGPRDEDDEDVETKEFPLLNMSAETTELLGLSKQACVLAQRSRYDEALSLFENLTQRYSDLLGPDHPDTLRTMHNLAFTLGQAGLHRRALDTYEHVQKLRVCVLGKDHPATLNTMHNRAWVLQQMGNTSSARKLYVQVLQMQTDTLGPLHKDTRLTQKHLSVLNLVPSCTIT